MTQAKQKTLKTMNVVLWIAQLVLAIGFFSGGIMKLFLPVSKLAEMWPWAADNSGLVVFTGIIDLLAGAGLVLPALLRIQPGLTIFAAYGTIALMVAACIFHISRGEAADIGVNIIFGIIAVFIVWGRLKKAPIQPKN